MIIGLSIATFTLIHVIVTLIVIATGFVVMAGMLGSKRLPGWTAIFLLTTVLTSVTGFMFLLDASFRKGFTPALGTWKIPFLHVLAPTQSNEPPFLIAQTVTLVFFVIVGIVAAIKFRPAVAMTVA